MKKWIVAVMAVGVIITQTGCLFMMAAGAGAGTVMYTRGDLETSSAKPMAEVYKAVEESCKEMDFEIYKHEQKEFSGLIVCNSDFGKVEFKMKSTSPQETHLSIRVGTFGDKGASQLILNKLKPKI